MVIGDAITRMVDTYKSEGGGDGTISNSLYSIITNLTPEVIKEYHELEYDNVNNIYDHTTDKKLEKDLETAKKTIHEYLTREIPRGVYNIPAITDGANTYTRILNTRDTHFKENLDMHKDAIIIDNKWIKNVFILPLRDIYSSDKLSKNPNNRNINPNIYYTASSDKPYNTAIGNYKVLNPKYQFTEYCDIRHSMGSLYSYQNVTVNHESKLNNYPLGRYYSESIDDTINMLYLTFGLPRYNTIFGFLQNTVSPLDAYILKTGTIPGKLFENLLKLIRMAGYTIFIGRVLLPHMLIGTTLLGISIGTGLFVSKKKTYYYMKPRMDFYLAMVKHIVTEFMIHLGILDDTTLPIAVGANNSTNKLKQKYALNPGVIRQLNSIIPGFIDEITGNVNIYDYVGSYYRRKKAFQSNYVSLENQLSRDLSAYVKRTHNENDDKAFLMNHTKADFGSFFSGHGIADTIFRGNLKGILEELDLSTSKALRSQVYEILGFTYGSKNLDIDYGMLNDLANYLVNYYRSIIILGDINNTGSENKQQYTIPETKRFFNSKITLEKYYPVINAAIKKFETHNSASVTGKDSITYGNLTNDEAYTILKDIDELVYKYIMANNINVLAGSAYANQHNDRGYFVKKANDVAEAIDTAQKIAGDALDLSDVHTPGFNEGGDGTTTFDASVTKYNTIGDLAKAMGYDKSYITAKTDETTTTISDSTVNDAFNGNAVETLESSTQTILNTYATGEVGSDTAFNIEIAKLEATGQYESDSNRDKTDKVAEAYAKSIDNQSRTDPNTLEDVSNIALGFAGGYEKIAFQTNYVGVQSVNISNGVSAIESESILNQGSNFFKKIYQNGLGTLLETTSLTNVFYGALTAAGTAIEGLTMGISNIFMGIAMGGRFRLPKIWSDSTSEFGYGHQFVLQLRSPYGDPVSQLINLYIPLAMILAGSLPISIGSVAYGSPLLCSAFQKGVCNIELGMITNVEIERNVGNMGMSLDRRPLGIDVHITITDLDSHGTASTNIQNMFNLPMSQIFGRDFTTKISRYIQSMAGISYADTNNSAVLTKKSFRYYKQYRDNNLFGISGDRRSVLMGIGYALGNSDLIGGTSIRDVAQIFSGAPDSFDINYGE